MKKFLALDVDGVLTNSFLTKLTDFLNEYTVGPKLKYDEIYDDIREYYHRADVSWGRGRDYLTSPGFVSSFVPRPEAQRFVENLRKKDISIKFVTSPYYKAPYWTTERTAWLERYFDANHDDIIYAREKWPIAAACLIDDKISNVKEWSANNMEDAILFAASTNLKPKSKYTEYFKHGSVHTDPDSVIIRTDNWSYIEEYVERKTRT